MRDRFDEKGCPLSSEVPLVDLHTEDHKTAKVGSTKWRGHDKPYLKYMHKNLHTSAELHYLYHTAKTMGPGWYANLGTYRGGSAFCLATALKEHGEGAVIAVDLFEGVNGEYTKEEMQTKVREYALPIKVCAGFTFEVVEQHQDKQFNFIFVDADHHYESVKLDFELWSPLLKPEGVIAFHDTNLNSVARFLEEIQPQWEQVDEVFKIKTFRRRQ